MKRTFKERINDLGLSYPRELLVIFLIAGVTIGAVVVSIIFLKEVYIALILFFLGVAGMYFYISRYRAMEIKNERSHVNELISLLSYLHVFIHNKYSVAESLKALIPFSGLFVQDALNYLVQQVEFDNSVTPFISFANRFNNKDITLLMLCIYQMKNGNTSEFDRKYHDIKNKYQNEQIENKRKSFGFVSSLPLFGAALIMIVLFIGVITSVGDYINVI